MTCNSVNNIKLSPYINHNPFKIEDYNKIFLGNFDKLVHGQQLKSSTLCVYCLACTFENIITTPEGRMHSIYDYKLYFWFLKKSILFIKNVKHIDLADSGWLTVVSHNFKILCSAYIVHCDSKSAKPGLGLSCVCDLKGPSTDIFNKALKDYLIWLWEYKDFSGDTLEDDIFKNFCWSSYHKARDNANRADIIFSQNTENLKVILTNGIFNKDAVMPTKGLSLQLLSWININNIPLSPAMSKWMDKNIKFYKGFYMQPFWHNDLSQSANRTRFWIRWRNRFTHPRCFRNYLKKKLICETKNWLTINYEQLDMNLSTLGMDCFAELFWLATTIDGLANGANGKFIMEPPRISGSISPLMTKLWKRKVERI